VAVAKRRVSTRAAVLPKAGSKAGRKTIRSVDQLLTAKQRRSLHRDLSEMARRRREAEASSGTLRLS
jgi:hypothetical protein